MSRCVLGSQSPLQTLPIPVGSSLPSRGLCVPANQTLGRGRGKGRPAEPSGSFPPRPGPAEHRDPRGPEARRPGRPAEPEGGKAEPGRLWPVSGCVALAERSRLRGAVLSVPAVPDSSTVKVRAGKPGSADPVGDPTVSGTLLFIFTQRNRGTDRPKLQRRGWSRGQLRAQPASARVCGSARACCGGSHSLPQAPCGRGHGTGLEMVRKDVRGGESQISWSCG